VTSRDPWWRHFDRRSIATCCRGDMEAGTDQNLLLVTNDTGCFKRKCRNTFSDRLHDVVDRDCGEQAYWANGSALWSCHQIRQVAAPCAWHRLSRHSIMQSARSRWANLSIAISHHSIIIAITIIIIIIMFILGNQW